MGNYCYNQQCQLGLVYRIIFETSVVSLIQVHNPLKERTSKLECGLTASSQINYYIVWQHCSFSTKQDLIPHDTRKLYSITIIKVFIALHCYPLLYLTKFRPPLASEGKKGQQKNQFPHKTCALANDSESF